MISQRLHENLVFYVYSVKIPFSKNMILPFFQKGTVDFFRKKKLKMAFPGSLKKLIFIVENIVFHLIEKLDNKKVYFYKKGSMILYTFMETFIGVFIYCYPKKKTGKLIYIIEF